MVFLPPESAACQHMDHSHCNDRKFNEVPATMPNTDVQMHFQPPQNTVVVQVNPGETFTIQSEDGTYRSISGPAQVPMVSHNGAIPPIYVPPGYVSQVIEEHGVRRVVVLPSGATGMMDGHFMAAPSIHPHPHLTGGVHGLQQTHIHPGVIPQNMIPGCRPDAFHFIQRPVYFPEEMSLSGSEYSDTSSLSSMQQSSLSTTPPSDMQSSASPRPPRFTSNHERSQLKVQESQPPSDPASNNSSQGASSMTSSPSSTSSFPSSPAGSPKAFQNTVQSNGHKPPKSPTASTTSLQPPHTVPVPSSSCHPDYHVQQNYTTHPSSVSPSASSDDEKGFGTSSDQLFEPVPLRDGKYFESVSELLASIRKPEVRDIQARSVHIRWEPLSVNNTSDELRKQISDATILFDLHIASRKKELGKFRSIYSGKESKYTYTDLRPASEYSLRLYATCNCEKGPASEITAFQTLSCAPDAPQAPKLQSRTKNSLQLKWTAPNENGEKIHKYHLEFHDGDQSNSFRLLSSNSQRQFKMQKLVPSHSYLFRLAAENKIGKSSWSPTVSFQTAGTVPGTPDAPRLIKAMVKSLTLAWTRAPGDVTSYTLEMNDESTGYGFRPCYNGTDLKYTVKDLVRSSHYKFRLLAHNNEGKSKHSDVVSYLTCPDKPQPPGKPQLKEVPRARSFRLSWDAPDDNGGASVNEYIMEMAQEKGDFKNNPVYAGADQECVVENIEPGNLYRLRVFCITNGGSSSPSDILTVTTPPVTPGPCQPPLLAMRPKSTCLTLKWEVPKYTGGASINLYEMNYCLASDGDAIPSEAYKGPDLECTVASLRPGTRYSFALRAANKVGHGPWSDRMEAVTSPGTPEKPDLPEATVLSPTSVHLQWNVPGDNGAEITNYRLQWGGEQGSMSVHMTGPVLVHEIQHLTPNTSYFYCLQAVNNVGQSPASEVGCVVTPPSCPDRVAGLRLGYVADDDVVTSVTTTQIPLQWEVPKDNGAEITGYKVHVQQWPSSNVQESSSNLNSELFEVEASLNYYTIESLQPDTNYSIKACATNSIGCGCFSHPLQARTKPLPPHSPELKCVQTTPSHLTLKWSSKSKASNGTQYLLQMRDKRGRFSTCYRGSNHSFGVAKLTENTTYRFRINASNAEGVGPFSKEYAFSTSILLPPTVEAPAVRDVQTSSCVVSWSRIERMRGDPIYYRITLQKVEDPNFEINVLRDYSSCLIHCLSPSTHYRLRVTAVRCCSSVRWQQREDSSASSELTDDGHESDLFGHASPAVTFTTLDGEYDDEMEVPRLSFVPEPVLVSDGKSSSKKTSVDEEVLHTAAAHQENNKASVSEAMSDEKKTAIFLAGYMISAILFAFLLQLLYVQ